MLAHRQLLGLVAELIFIFVSTLRKNLNTCLHLILFKRVENYTITWVLPTEVVKKPKVKNQIHICSNMSDP